MEFHKKYIILPLNILITCFFFLFYFICDSGELHSIRHQHYDGKEMFLIDWYYLASMPTYNAVIVFFMTRKYRKKMPTCDEEWVVVLSLVFECFLDLLNRQLLTLLWDCKWFRVLGIFIRIYVKKKRDGLIKNCRNSLAFFLADIFI